MDIIKAQPPTSNFGFVPKAVQKILLCDDDPLFHLSIKSLLTPEGYSLISVHSPEELMIALKKEAIQIILLDIHFNDSTQGLSWIPRLKELDPEIAIIIVSGRSDTRTVRDAMQRGADDYFTKNDEPGEIVRIVRRAHERLMLLKRQSQHDFENKIQQNRHVLLGDSQAIQNLRKMIEKVAKGTANVIIYGETGTGKELVARNLRQYSEEGSLRPFVAIDSSTIQSSMAESMLFGHEKGAFTGAIRTTKGIFEEAHGGTVYFDEIANMSLDNQAKLLRVLQEREVCRLGSSKTISLDFRVVCATNQDLEELVSQGRFKADLAQRLCVIPIIIPPLREHREDIPVLIQHFCSNLKPARFLEFSDSAKTALFEYPWPGNVRELFNLIHFLSTLVDQSRIELEDLPDKFRIPSSIPVVHQMLDSHSGLPLPLSQESTQPQGTHPPSSPAVGKSESETLSFYDRISQFEKITLLQEFCRYQGNIRRMASELKMDRSHLHSKLRNFGIHPSSPKPNLIQK